MLAAFNITLLKFRTSNCAQKIWMPLTFTCLKSYSPNANIYTGHLYQRNQLLKSPNCSIFSALSLFSFLLFFPYPFFQTSAKSWGRRISIRKGSGIYRLLHIYEFGKARFLKCNDNSIFMTAQQRDLMTKYLKYYIRGR